MQGTTDVSRSRLSGGCHCSAEEKHGCIIHWSEESVLLVLLMSNRAVSLLSCIIKSFVKYSGRWDLLLISVMLWCWCPAEGLCLPILSVFLP